MTFVFAAGALCALIIGAKFRVPTLVAANFVVVIAGLFLGWCLSLPFFQVLRDVVYMILIMQLAYVLGLGTAAFLHRAPRE